MTSSTMLDPALGEKETTAVTGRHSSYGSATTPSRIVFVGPIDTGVPCGSTVKNELVVRGLTTLGVDVQVIDTGSALRKERFAQLARLLRALVSNRQVVVSASTNGVRTLVPLLGALSVVVPRLRFAVLVTGSHLPRQVAALDGPAKRFFKWSLSRASGIFAEGAWIRRELSKVGVWNSSYLPNPRPRPPVKWDSSALATGRFTYISRIFPEKGIESAIAAVERLRGEGHDIGLDVYGPVADSYSSRFDALVSESPGTTYHGVLAPEAVVGVLAAKAGLLFPTTLLEGMPGILVEAAMVGMPVISTTLDPIAESIEDGVSGLLVEPGDTGALAEALRRMVTRPAETRSMADALGRRAATYSLDNVAASLCRELAEQGWQ